MENNTNINMSDGYNIIRDQDATLDHFILMRTGFFMACLNKIN